MRRKKVNNSSQKVKKKPNHDFINHAGSAYRDGHINCYDFTDEIYYNVKPKDYLNDETHKKGQD
jgi:hypothetical protein